MCRGVDSYEIVILGDWAAGYRGLSLGFCRVPAGFCDSGMEIDKYQLQCMRNLISRINQSLEKTNRSIKKEFFQ